MLKADQRGFSLVELLLTIILISVVLAIGYNAFAYGLKAWENYVIRQEAEAAVRLASLVITNEVNYASYLEIRQQADDWASTEVQENDRLIFINNAGDIVLREITAAGNVDTTIAHTEKSTLELSFSKPADNNIPDSYLDNSLKFSVKARYKDKDGADEDGDGIPEKAVIYSSNSAVLISNMLEGSGFPISAESLYSQTTNCTPGDRILYRTTVQLFVPTAPGGGFTCGL